MEQAQSYSRSRHKQKNTRLYIPLLGSLVLLLALVNWDGISAGPERTANALRLYARVVRLYTREPDVTLAMPLLEVRKKGIANTWHAPRSSDRLHEGQDIFAPRGTPIYSATRGVIFKIGENTLGGQTVLVFGPGGRLYYYAHLDGYAAQIREGDYVTTQTVLGYVGSTGNAKGTPPHLHFGVYTANGPIDPLPLLRDRSAGLREGSSLASSTSRQQ
jgi:murein DD-endopeptidase MepM/ murein hydrolase activator NlpD